MPKPGEPVLDNNLDDLLSLYYKSFIDCLTSLKVDTEIFTLKDFYKEVDKCAPLKFGHCIMMTNVIMAPREAAKSSHDVSGNATFPTFGQRANKKLLHILQIFDKKRWLVD